MPAGDFASLEQVIDVAAALPMTGKTRQSRQHLAAGFPESVPAALWMREQVQKLNSLLRRELSQLPGVVLHSPEDALPYVLNFSAGKVRGETMLHFLAQREVYVSSGSACGKAKPSHVLESMGLPKEQVQSALRVSFSRFSTEEDVGALVEGLKVGLAQLAVGS